MKIKEVTTYLEELAPLSSQESYDNSGLIVGDPNVVVSGALISLDCIESTVEEPRPAPMQATQTCSPS